MEISSIGVGSLAIGGTGWISTLGATDDEVSVRAIHEAVDRGINWIHASATYAHGHAQDVVARAVRTLPASRRPYVFSSDAGRRDPKNPFGGHIDLSPAAVRAQVEDSLQRLGVECLDLFQFHLPDPKVPIEESWGALGDLMREGKVRADGLSNHPVELLDRAEVVRHVGSIQPPFSLLDRSAAADLLPWAEAHQTGVIVYAPMQHGLLAGAFTRERVDGLLYAGDLLRSRLAWFREPELTRALALVEELKPIAERHNTTLGAVAVAWDLAWPGVTGTIVGLRRPDQVAGFIDAMDLQLTDADLDDIQQALERTGAGGVLRRDTGDWVGPNRPTRPPRKAEAAARQ
jgi:aryl-alcohol dehydrogenase-like predicted oxidoreductase